MNKIIQSLIKEKRNALRVQAQNILESAKTEKRELTEDEKVELEIIKEELAALKEEVKSLNEPEVTEESASTENTVEEPEEPASTETVEEEAQTEEPNNTEEESASTETEEETEQPENQDDKQENKRNIAMKKNVSILGAIKAVVEGRSFDAATEQLISETKKEMRAGGMDPTAAIVLPLEARALSVADEEGDLATIEWKSIMQPLFAKMILGNIGATQITANSEVRLPILTKSTVSWLNELGTSGGTAPAASSVTLKPHRLSCTVPISNALLAVDGNLGVETAVMENILGAIAEKLQDSIFSTATGVTGQQPSGIFAGMTASAVTDFEDVTALESNLEEANVENIKYVLSAKSKAAFRNMDKGTSGNGLVYASGEMDGVPAYTTSCIDAKTFAAADWKYLYNVVFNGIEIIPDKVTRAPFGETLLTVAMYTDFKFVKPEALVYGTTAQ